MTVYVNWYHNVLEGELLEGEHLGMRQVRITLDGHRVVALFTPAHIYPTRVEAQLQRRDATPGLPVINIDRPTTPNEALQPCKQFLEGHWDYDHNHLHVDALDEFYQLWRYEHGASRPSANVADRFIVAVDPAAPGADFSTTSTVHSPDIPCQPPSLLLPSATVPVASPTGNTKTKKLTRKQLLSTDTIRYNDSVQTSIFDLL